MLARSALRRPSPSCSLVLPFALVLLGCSDGASQTSSDTSPVMEGTSGAPTNTDQGNAGATQPSGGLSGSTNTSTPPSRAEGGTPASGGGPSGSPSDPTAAGAGGSGDGGEGVGGTTGEPVIGDRGGSGGQGSDQLAPDGDACDTADDCASGVCEGTGCGEGQGTCVPEARPCTRDLVTYCDCDGNTFQGSGSCPGRRVASEGACDDSGGGGEGDDGDACGTGTDCVSGICEGLGCGDENGTCVSPLRACTADLGEYCGCDGETFYGSGSCPGDRYASVGPCPE